MDIYTVVLLVLVLVGAVAVYVYYMKEKGAHLAAIERGVCPSCKHDTIGIADRRSHGCSGTETLHVVCDACGYENSFVVPTGGCGSGGCRR